MAEDRWWRRHRNRRTRRTTGPWRYPCRPLYPSNWRTPRPTSRGGCHGEPQVGHVWISKSLGKGKGQICKMLCIAYIYILYFFYISDCLKKYNFDMQWNLTIELIKSWKQYISVTKQFISRKQSVTLLTTLFANIIVISAGSSRRKHTQDQLTADGKGDKKRKSYCDIQGNNAQCHYHEPLILVRARTIQIIQN